MRAELTAGQGRTRAISRVILGVGLAAAFLIFLAAPPTPDDAGDGQEETKAGQRQMEVFGGTANVLAAELRTWFASLWQGRRLAFTVAALTWALASCYRFFATPLPSGDRAAKKPIEPPAEPNEPRGGGLN